MSAQEHVIIIGSGPAGFAAAIYTSRANLQPLLFEGAAFSPSGMQPLGQLALTTEVENYPGFPIGDMDAYLDSVITSDRFMPYREHAHEKNGVTGPELMELMRQQALNFGTRIVPDDVVDIDLSKRPFKVKTLEGQEHTAASIIIATGARANYLGLPSEQKYLNRGVSA